MPTSSPHEDDNAEAKNGPCQNAEGVRLVVALATLGTFFVLLLASLFAGGDNSALVTGLLASLSGVLAWYFGSQGLASAQQRAAGAQAATENVADEAAAARSQYQRLVRDATRAQQALALALSVPGVKEKLEAELPAIQGRDEEIELNGQE